jgi:hypothetical protein
MQRFGSGWTDLIYTLFYMFASVPLHFKDCAIKVLMYLASNPVAVRNADKRGE